MTNQQNILEKINNRIEELKEEAENLVVRRQSLSNEIEDINIKLTQILGAIKELSLLLED
jgi:uncharacterized protein YoxC